MVTRRCGAVGVAEEGPEKRFAHETGSLLAGVEGQGSGLTRGRRARGRIGGGRLGVMGAERPKQKFIAGDAGALLPTEERPERETVRGTLGLRMKGHGVHVVVAPRR